MHDATLVILNSLKIKCHIRRPLIKNSSGKHVYSLGNASEK